MEITKAIGFEGVPAGRETCFDGGSRRLHEKYTELITTWTTYDFAYHNVMDPIDLACVDASGKDCLPGSMCEVGNG
jgi:hypothetical protein